MGDRRIREDSRPATAPEIVAARPITEVWVGLGGDVPKHGRARAFYRDGDNRQAVSLNDAKACWYDHRDQTGGGVLDLVQRTLGCNRRGALCWLADFNGLPLRDRPLTGAERRAYALARQETAQLVAWKERLIEVLKWERRRWYRVYHSARVHLLQHGLESTLGDAMAALYNVAENEADRLRSDIEILTAADYRELLLIFRELTGR